MNSINDYISRYFHRTKTITSKAWPETTCTMQFFQRHDNTMLCGINDVITFLKSQFPGQLPFTIKAIREASIIAACEPVLEITGLYKDFGHYEGIIDGILAQETTIATNAYHLTQVAGQTPIIYMNDRNSGYWNQPYDGYAAYQGGIRLFTSEAEVSRIRANDYQVIGTVPHALIQHCKGDALLALTHYKKYFPHDKLVALVDYQNDVITTSLACVAAFADLYAVRVDTAPSLLDVSLEDKPVHYGVSVALIKKLRQALDTAGFKHVKIIVSSGFNVAKMQKFEAAQAPVDYYGIGADFANNCITFTGDCVKLNQADEAKVGRSYRANPRLVDVSSEQQKVG